MGAVYFFSKAPCSYNVRPVWLCGRTSTAAKRCSEIGLGTVTAGPDGEQSCLTVVVSTVLRSIASMCAAPWWGAKGGRRRKIATEAAGVGPP